MKEVERLNVIYHGRTVGRLCLTPEGRRCAFEYDKAWLNDGFSISPLELPLKPDLFIAKAEPFDGNFGIFEDSLPDGYGRYLLNRLLRGQGIEEKGLTPLQRLSIVGRAGMGALEYVPETRVGTESPLPLLDDLQSMALEVLSEKSSQNAEVLYYNSGNSGGCRPKCLLRDEEGAWLVKFRHTFDPKDMGRQEFLYNKRARACGIEVADFKLIDGKYFASRRFDIIDGERVHAATAGGLLGVSIHFPNLDYKTLLHLTGYLTQDARQVEEMFRRMAFNVLTDNKDDHAKNFSFIYRDKAWRLAPAYDLTPSPTGYNGEHATTVNGKGQPSTEDMLAVGESIRVPRKRGMEIIMEVATTARDILSKSYRGLIRR